MSRKKEWLPFEEARKIVRKDAVLCGIDTERKWQYQKKYLYKRASNIPYSPQIAYKDSGWISWADWLGTNNIRGQLKKYTVNHDFFKRWSADMAYILGFWWADGYIRKRKGRYGYSYGFGICQHSRAKYLLRKIMDCMGANNPVWQPKSRPDMCHFELISKTIFDDIIIHGGKQRKSKTIRMPKIPNKYFPDFIRGLFDGDGCIFKFNKKRSCSSYICSGSKKFLNDLKKIMEDKGFKTNIYSNGNKKHPCFKLCFGVVQTRKLGNFMYKNYKNKLLLKRKFEMFKTAGEQTYEF